MCWIDICLLIASFIHVHAHCMMWNHTDISKLSRTEMLVSTQPFFFAGRNFSIARLTAGFI